MTSEQQYTPADFAQTYQTMNERDNHRVDYFLNVKRYVVGFFLVKIKLHYTEFIALCRNQL